MNLNEYILRKLFEKEETVNNEKDFREFAMAKMEAVFKDKLDTERAKKTINGFLEDNKELVDNDDWGELVGMFNQSFAAN